MPRGASARGSRRPRRRRASRPCPGRALMTCSCRDRSTPNAPASWFPSGPLGRNHSVPSIRKYRNGALRMPSAGNTAIAGPRPAAGGRPPDRWNLGPWTRGGGRPLDSGAGPPRLVTLAGMRVRVRGGRARCRSLQCRTAAIPSGPVPRLAEMASGFAVNAGERDGVTARIRETGQSGCPLPDPPRAASPPPPCAGPTAGCIPRGDRSAPLFPPLRRRFIRTNWALSLPNETFLSCFEINGA